MAGGFDILKPTISSYKKQHLILFAAHNFVIVSCKRSDIMEKIMARTPGINVSS